MPWWAWLVAATAALVALWLGFVVWLYAAGRRTEARALIGFIPDCAILLSRLLRDSRVPRRDKALLAVLLGYLALPFDLVPVFNPVAGQLDDVIIVALVLRRFIRSGGDELVREHWPGPQESLAVLLRLAGGRR